MVDFNASAPKRMVAIYIRVSTPEQKQDGYSPEHQRKRLLSYVNDNKALNLQTNKNLIFEDVGSGNDLNREGLEKIRELIKQKKIQGVVVWKIDRLSRNLKHLLVLFEEFQKNEVSFISIQENIDFTGPIGRLIFQMFGAIAQFERELIRGRTYSGKLTSAEQGNYIGGVVPYGYKKVPNIGGKGSKLEIIPEEKEWVEKIFDWYVYKQWGDLKISLELNRLKVPQGQSVRKKSVNARWTEKKIRTMFHNTIYYGKHFAIKKDENGKDLRENEQTVVFVPSCVSELLFLQAQKSRDSRVGGSSNITYLLSGKIVDVSSELPRPKSLIGVKRTKGGISYRRKGFTDNATDVFYPNLEIPGVQLEEFVWNRILSAFENPMAFVQKYIQLSESEDTVTKDISVKLQTLRKRAVEITEIENPNLDTALIKGVLDEERYKTNSKKLDKELNNVHLRIQKLEEDLQGLVWVRNEVKNIKQLSSDISTRVKNLSQEQKRLLCDLFVEKVEITKTENAGEKRNVTAQIYFRFNLSQLKSASEGVSTAQSLSEAGNSTCQNEDNSLGGEGGRSGYVSIKVSAKLERKRDMRVSNGNRYWHIETTWIEVEP